MNTKYVVVWLLASPLIDLVIQIVDFLAYGSKYNRYDESTIGLSALFKLIIYFGVAYWLSTRKDN